MPVLDAAALEIDPEGMALLRSVLQTGRRRKRASMTPLRFGHAPACDGPAGVLPPVAKAVPRILEQATH